MQDFLEKLRENPRIIVVTLIAAGVLALALGNGGDSNNETGTDQTQQETTSQSTDATDEGDNAEEVAGDTEEATVGSEPDAGPVEVQKEETTYKSTVRKGDNQTVIVRQMINNYLSDQSQSLSAEQRLYVETVVVNSLPRDDLIYPGETIEVEEETIANTVADSGELTDSELALWSTYL